MSRFASVPRKNGLETRTRLDPWSLLKSDQRISIKTMAERRVKDELIHIMEGEIN